MPLPPLTAERMSSFLPMLHWPETLSAAPLSLSSWPVTMFSYLNWRNSAATVKWPQSPLVSQRAVRSGAMLSPVLKRAPLLRKGVTVVCGFSRENDHGPFV